ncbi:hypothetical protein RKE38_10790 [Phycicoccus sp. M110.8]|uniref:hemerythrin domain-containing protein n=1 Tax=Phycicoccus sp. M110.8 TaxID=3075433 RepID=UPI0028FD641A|nr:hemerythrin domain-containing protein [Phycicoccus sp. M110.8]MDU0314172.1 hypothetical protein [Phycicoccus sp. M110.8]
MQADVDPEVVAFAREVGRQHRRLGRLMQDVLTAGDDRWEGAWQQLRAYLAAHEAAERLVMHPMFRARDRDDLSVIDRVAEEEDIARAMTTLEGVPRADGWFRAPLLALCELVTAHSRREEHDELAGFLHRITEDDAAELLEVLLLVERVAGTLAAAGGDAPFAAMLDLAEDELDGLLVASRGRGPHPG